jgi:hypothetical protein
MGVLKCRLLKINVVAVVSNSVAAVACSFSRRSRRYHRDGAIDTRRNDVVDGQTEYRHDRRRFYPLPSKRRGQRSEEYCLHKVAAIYSVTPTRRQDNSSPAKFMS